MQRDPRFTGAHIIRLASNVFVNIFPTGRLVTSFVASMMSHTFGDIWNLFIASCRFRFLTSVVRREKARVVTAPKAAGIVSSTLLKIYY